MALATLTLNSPILNITATKRKLSQSVTKSVRECREEVRQTSIKSVPQGRVYKRGGRFHRASRRGQPPAVDSGDLVNTIQDQKTGEFSGEVVVTEPYGEPLENKLDRNFVEKTAKKYERKFLANVTDALK